MSLFLVYQFDDIEVEPIVYPYRYLDHAFNKVQELCDGDVLIDEETNGMIVSDSELNHILNDRRIKIKCPFDNYIFVRKFPEF